VPSTETVPASVPQENEHYGRIVWSFAWPVVLLNSFQVVNNLLDRFFIGHLSGSALLAQSASMTITFLLFSLAMALATGPGAIVSRAFGAGNRAEFQEAARQSVSLSLVLGILIALVGVGLAPILGALVIPASEPEARRLMIQYVGIFCAGLPAIYVIQALAASMRGVGDSRSPMWISGMQIALHIFLNFILIFPPRAVQFGGASFTLPGFNLGLAGAATALSASAIISAIIYLAYSARTPLGACWKMGFPTKAWAARILRIATPSAFQNVLRVMSLVAFMAILAGVPHGAAAVAALGVAFAVESIMFMPAFGLAFAASALVGQSLGMKRPDRAERIAWLASHYGALVILITVVPIFFGAHKIASTMISTETTKVVRAATAAPDPRIEQKRQAVDEAASLIRWLCLTEVMFAYAMILVGALQGAGDTVRPLWLTVVSLWVMRVPLAFLFAKVFAWGATGAWAAMSLTQAMQGLFAILAFKQGHWKTAKV